MNHWKSKQKTNQAIGKPARERNQEILNTVLEDVPEDGKWHHVEMMVRWEGYHVVIRDNGLKVDGESVGSD